MRIADAIYRFRLGEARSDWSFHEILSRWLPHQSKAVLVIRGSWLYRMPLARRFTGMAISHRLARHDSSRHDGDYAARGEHGIAEVIILALASGRRAAITPVFSDAAIHRLFARPSMTEAVTTTPRRSRCGR